MIKLWVVTTVHPWYNKCICLKLSTDSAFSFLRYRATSENAELTEDKIGTIFD